MRLIGQLANEPDARTFGDYLFVQGIENRVEKQKEGEWAIWVIEEDKIPEATKLLADFQANSSEPKFRSEAKGAATLRAEQDKDLQAYQKRLRDRRHLFRPLTEYGFGPVTFMLIVASIVVYFLSKFGADRERIMSLYITNYTVSDMFISWNSSLPEIRHGEIWRLFTPILIHAANPLHIIFNMLCLRDLGSMIEARQSSLHLVLLVLVIAAGSNLAQFYIGHAPNFGGMSGVVYGLLGFVWLRGKFDPGSGLFLHPSTVTMMLVWLVVCFTGAVGHIANSAHVAGLLMGVAWGYLSSLRYR